MYPPHTLFGAAALALVPTAVLAGGVASEPPLILEYDRPTLDRWNYPFNPSAGSRTSASVFGALGQEMTEGLTFDQRDAQFLLGFDLSADLGDAACAPEDLLVTEAVLTVTVFNSNNFRYDPTLDPNASYFPSGAPGAIADTDLGRPLEVFGVGYRNGFTRSSFVENAPWGPSVAWEARNAFPIDFDDLGLPRDVSNSVSGSPTGEAPADPFQPRPFAIGQIDTVTPGQTVPANSVVTYTIDVGDPDVQQYLRDGLVAGEVRFMVTSLQDASFSTQDGAFASFYTNENFFGSGRRATLRLVLECEIEPAGCTADLDGNGSVNLDDFSILASQFGSGPAACAGGCTADLDGNASVDLDDFSIFASQFGSGPADCQ